MKSSFEQGNKVVTNAKLSVTWTVSKCGKNQQNFNSFARWYEKYEKCIIFDYCEGKKNDKEGGWNPLRMQSYQTGGISLVWL